MLELIPRPIKPSSLPAPPQVNAAPEFVQPRIDGHNLTIGSGKRWILQLEDPPLARYTGGITGLRATASQATGAIRLDTTTSAAQAYLAYLEAQQALVISALQQVVPGAYAERDYQVIFNGLAVNLPLPDEEADRWLTNLPGVKAVFRERTYYPDMFASLPLIDAPALWETVGGQSEAGRGVLLASIDYGIHPDNPCFNPTGYVYPPGFPKFDTSPSAPPFTTTEKIIVARAYFRDDDPPVAGDAGTWPGPERDNSHGTHTSGSMGCIPNTLATVDGITKTISGVAPAAYLLSYKVFYASADTFPPSAANIELIAAIEDAVADGAQIVNNSWGGYDADPPLEAAYDAAWDAGLVIVFSAGNDGPDPSTISLPHLEDPIYVGASTTGAFVSSRRVKVTGPGTVPGNLTNIGARGGKALGQAVGPAPLVDVATVTVGGINTLCDTETITPTNALSGTIAVISLGSCGNDATFADIGEKVANAKEAGAIYTILYSNTTDDISASVTPGSRSHEGVLIGRTDGENIRQWIAGAGGAAEGQIEFVTGVASNIPDRLALFSARGPIEQYIKPDLVAPGVYIVSAGYGEGSGEEVHKGFGLSTGTSMAAPHVSGAAAVLKQLHPAWTPLQIKSALMSTAAIDLLDHDGSEVGVLDRGAGRIDLGRAGDPGLTFDKPSLSFGVISPAVMRSITVTATDVFSRVAGTPLAYSLAISETGDLASTANFTISVHPSTLTLDGEGDTASFEVAVEVAQDAPPGDYEGWVWLRRNDAHELHIPVWARIIRFYLPLISKD